MGGVFSSAGEAIEFLPMRAGNHFSLNPHTLSSMTGSGHVKYMANPFFDFYMTTCHPNLVPDESTTHGQVAHDTYIATRHSNIQL